MESEQEAIEKWYIVDGQMQDDEEHPVCTYHAKAFRDGQKHGIKEEYDEQRNNVVSDLAFLVRRMALLILNSNNQEALDKAADEGLQYIERVALQGVGPSPILQTVYIEILKDRKKQSALKTVQSFLDEPVDKNEPQYPEFDSAKVRYGPNTNTPAAAWPFPLKPETPPVAPPPATQVYRANLNPQFSDSFDLTLKNAMSKVTFEPEPEDEATPPKIAKLLGDSVYDDILKERDEAEDRADEFAELIATMTGVDLGEYTSSNDPLQNAVDAANEWIRKRDLKADQPIPDWTKPKFKPLVWTDPQPSNDTIRYDHVTTNTPFGAIEITWKGHKEYAPYDVEFSWTRGMPYQFGTLNAAKINAEVIYRNFVLECLEIQS